MKEFFAGLEDIAGAINEVITPRLRQLMRLVLKRIRIAAAWVIIVPLVLFVVALLPEPWGGRNPVLFVTLLLLIPIIFVLLASNAIATILLIEAVPISTPLIGRFVAWARRGIKFLRIFVGTELLIGLYLAWTPLGNDRILALRLLLLVAAGACFIGINKTIVKLLAVAGIIMTLIFFLGGRDKAEMKLRGTTEGASSTANYQRIVCDDAFEHDIQEPTGNHFTVTLHEGCFGGFVHLPKGWHEWHAQAVGNDPSWWYAIWFEGGGSPIGPFNRYATPNFPYHANTFRLQGKEGEQFLFYTSETDTQAQPKKSDEPAVRVLPPPSPIDGETTPPSILSKVEGAYTPEAQRARIQGIVKLSFIVDENGDPQDITVVQSLGHGLDEQAIEALQQWKFQPGMRAGQPIKFRSSVDMLFRMV